MPGSTIIVPRDDRPLDGLSLVETVSPILASLSITAASIAAITIIRFADFKFINMKKISDHFLLSLFFFSTTIYSSPNSYIFPNIDIPSYSNYGTLGLIQLPNARFHKEEQLPSHGLICNHTCADLY